MRNELAALYRLRRNESRKGWILAREAFVIRRCQKNICAAINILKKESLVK